MSCNVLFLCTGNFYRSRFAEILFNHLSAQAGLPWRADSRGLATELLAANLGPMSPLAIDALGDRGISVDGNLRFPAQLQEPDLLAADLIVALNEDEHRFYLTRRYPGWEDHVRYWRIADVDELPAHLALAAIDREVMWLVGMLGDTQVAPAKPTPRIPGSS